MAPSHLDNETVVESQQVANIRIPINHPKTLPRVLGLDVNAIADKYDYSTTRFPTRPYYRKKIIDLEREGSIRPGTSHSVRRRLPQEKSNSHPQQ